MAASRSSGTSWMRGETRAIAQVPVSSFFIRNNRGKSKAVEMQAQTSPRVVRGNPLGRPIVTVGTSGDRHAQAKTMGLSRLDNIPRSSRPYGSGDRCGQRSRLSRGGAKPRPALPSLERSADGARRQGADDGAT